MEPMQRPQASAQVLAQGHGCGEGPPAHSHGSGDHQEGRRSLGPEVSQSRRRRACSSAGLHPQPGSLCGLRLGTGAQLLPDPGTKEPGVVLEGLGCAGLLGLLSLRTGLWSWQAQHLLAKECPELVPGHPGLCTRRTPGTRRCIEFSLATQA